MFRTPCPEQGRFLEDLLVSTPHVWPRAHTTAALLHRDLEHVANELVGLTATGGALLPRYLDWALGSASRLQRCLHAADIDRLIRTRTFWAALSLDSDSLAAQHLVNSERSDRQRHLHDVVESLAKFVARFQGVPETAAVLVADTNVLIGHAVELAEVDWHARLPGLVHEQEHLRIVVPLVVIDELDRLKRHHDKTVRSGARAMLKAIHKHVGDRIDEAHILSGGPLGRGKTVTLEVLAESPDHVRLPSADDEIVDVAARLTAMLGTRVMMITYDTGADIRAGARALRHQRIRHQDTSGQAGTGQ